jgi:hypothetical protein
VGILDLAYHGLTSKALRLYPIVPGNGRTAVRDTTLPVGGGPDGKSPIFVKAGTQVNYQVSLFEVFSVMYFAESNLLMRY